MSRERSMTLPGLGVSSARRWRKISVVLRVACVCRVCVSRRGGRWPRRWQFANDESSRWFEKFRES